MSKTQFPIYCKDHSGAHAYMIISKSIVLTITNAPHEISMALTDFHGIDHGTYDLWKAGELIESNARDFNIYRIQMNNHLISIGVSKKAQTQKSES